MPDDSKFSGEAKTEAKRIADAEFRGYAKGSAKLQAAYDSRWDGDELKLGYTQSFNGFVGAMDPDSMKGKRTTFAHPMNWGTFRRKPGYAPGLRGYNGEWSEAKQRRLRPIGNMRTKTAWMGDVVKVLLNDTADHAWDGWDPNGR